MQRTLPGEVEGSPAVPDLVDRPGLARDRSRAAPQPMPTPPPTTHPELVDWSAVALRIAEQAGVAAVLLDASGKILLVTPATVRTLGWGYETVGGDWIDQCAARGVTLASRVLLGKAMTGGLRTF